MDQYKANSINNYLFYLIYFLSSDQVTYRSIYYYT